MNEQTSSQALCCPECGASQVDGLTCWEMLGAIIAWEYGDPDLLAEHFLTVASYNLQHPAQFTETVLAGLRAVFCERLDNGLGIAEIRRRIGNATAGAARVRKPEPERQLVLRQWHMTIADVYCSNQPTRAAERVGLWAATIRREL